MMKANLDTRLSKLESATPAGRVFYLWQPATTEALNELMRSRGIGPADAVYVFSWIGEPTGCE